MTPSPAPGAARTDPVRELMREVARFAAEREWDRYHSPKNLSMALIGEVGELIAHFQWLNERESAQLPADRLAMVEQEIGDVVIYLVRLCDQLGIDPLAAAHRKLKVNAVRYPVEKARGNNRKYDEFD